MSLNNFIKSKEAMIEKGTLIVSISKTDHQKSLKSMFAIILICFQKRACIFYRLKRKVI